MLLAILAILLIVKRFQRFDGQLFLLYLMLYAGGRSVIEEYRGDEERGFVFDGFFSNSQFIALILFLIAFYFYFKKWRESRKA